MITKREDILNAMAVLELVPERPGMSASEYIKVTTSGSKMQMSLASEVLGEVEISIKGKFPCKQPFYIHRQVAEPFFRAGRDTKKDFEWTAEESQTKKKGKIVLSSSLKIKQGRREALLSTLPEVMGYGKIKVERGGLVVKLSDEQRSLIRAAHNSAGMDPSSPELNCVYLTSKGIVMSYNTVTMFVGKATRFQESIPFPLHLLTMLQHAKNPKIHLQKDKVILEFDEGMISQTLSVKARKDFPVKGVLDKIKNVDKLPKICEVNAGRLFKSMDRFTKYMSSVRRQDSILKLRVDKGSKEMILEALVPHTQLMETVRLEEKAKHNMKGDWPLDAVIPIIQFIGSQKQTITLSTNEEKKTPYYVTTDDVTLLIARRAK